MIINNVLKYNHEKEKKKKVEDKPAQKSWVRFKIVHNFLKSS